MKDLEKIVVTIREKLGIWFDYYREGDNKKGVPVCERQFDETDEDGEFLFFRFSYKQIGFIGVLSLKDGDAKKYALLLPAYIESFADKESELTKIDYLRKILLGECSSKAVEKFANRFSVSGMQAFVLVVSVPKLMDEAISLIANCAGNTIDTVVRMDEKTCAFVKFMEEDTEEYNSSSDYAEFLVQSLKEELGIDARVGVGSTVKKLKDSSLSYAQGASALRYAEVFGEQGSVHSYREYALVKMLEDASESRLRQYLSELMDEGTKEIMDDEEMVETAEEFLRCSLNVSETSRNLYMHRNTLLYRLDKIQKATGLNIRAFPDAVSFRVLTILYKLLEE